MLLGYNTNGLAHHDPLQAIEVLSEIGYRSVAITVDHHVLNPFADELPQRIAEMRRVLDQHAFRNVVETGARFLLDPRVKHEPTLMTADSEQRHQRIDFLCRAVDIAAQLGSDAVSLWSGIMRDDVSTDEAMWRLVSGLRPVIDYAEQRDVTIAFEPEPGMFIDAMERFSQLLDEMDSPPNLRLTMDVGHLHCLGEVPIADYIRKWKERIANVHIEDMRVGVHEHLMFGEGDMEFGPILQALAEIGYSGGLHVELSRHSHEGPDAARRAFEFLSGALEAV